MPQLAEGRVEFSARVVDRAEGRFELERGGRELADGGGEFVEEGVLAVE